MQKSKIEWTEYTSNPVKGKCPVGCSYCYAERMRKRFGRYEDIRGYPEELDKIEAHRKPARIFMGSTIELFHDDTIQFMPEIMRTVKRCPQHTFIFLTKCPENLQQFSPFPDNCFVGVSVTEPFPNNKPLASFEHVKAPVKFISFEPLLKWIVPLPRLTEALERAGISWITCGQQTPVSVKTMPKIEWVLEIIEACKKAGIPYFIKNSLKGLMGDNVVQDMPKGVGLDH